MFTTPIAPSPGSSTTMFPSEPDHGFAATDCWNHDVTESPGRQSGQAWRSGRRMMRRRITAACFCGRALDARFVVAEGANMGVASGAEDAAVPRLPRSAATWQPAPRGLRSLLAAGDLREVCRQYRQDIGPYRPGGRMSQADLALLTGVAQSTICRLE